MTRFAWLPFALLVAGCSRDLTLPSEDVLHLVLTSDVVAPRERLQLSAGGGAGRGYRFAFAPNGKLSGEAASLTDEGAYQAGERGLAQDVVRVTDAAGNVAEARITVGARLAITPPLVALAPGARLVFTASGGKPPWRFTLEDGGVLQAGAYEAAAPGDRVETVTLSDATGDALATARAQVSIGSGLLIFPAVVDVAPRERVRFVGLGGQPPYTFSLAPDAGSAGSLPPTVDATGAYQAGANDLGDGGVVTDRVVLTDANGQRVEASLVVGPPLTAPGVGRVLPPGVTVQVLAQGGLPPYRFAFRARGNRSGGTIDAITGRYTPGTNSGAVDLLAVEDSAGVVIALPDLTVGARRLPLRTGLPMQLVDADLDGDSARDLVVLDDQLQRFSTLTRLAESSPMTSIIPLSGLNAIWAFVAEDLDGDLDEDLVGSTDDGLVPFIALPGGSLAEGPRLPGSISTGMVALADGWAYAGHADDGGCLISRVRSQPLTSSTPVSECAVDAGTRVGALAVTPMSGGAVAVAWTSSLSGPLELRYLDGASPANTTRSAQLALPQGHVLPLVPLGVISPNGVEPLLSAPREVGPERLYSLLYDADAGVSGLWGVDLAGPTSLGPPTPIPFPGGVVAAGLAATVEADGLPVFAAWNLRAGVLPILKQVADGGLEPTQRLDIASGVSAARFLDVDGDRLSDLVLARISSDALEVLRGDGLSRFGARPHFAAGAPPLGGELGDLDGDGVADPLAFEGTSAHTFWWDPGSQQLANGPSSPLGLTPSPRALVGDFSGDGRADLLGFDDQSRLYFAQGLGDGTFEPAQQVTSPDGGLELAPPGAPNIGLLRVDFGGPAAGPDLLVTARDLLASTQNVALIYIRLSPTSALAVRQAPPANTRRCVFTTADVDGQAPSDLLAACRQGSSSNRALYTALATGSGQTLAFGAWSGPSPQTLEDSWGTAAWLPAFDDETARYLVSDSWLAEVRVTAGAVSLARRDHSRPRSTGAAVRARLTAIPNAPRDVLFGPLQPDDPEAALTVLSWDGTAWTERRLLTGNATPAAALQPPDGGVDHVLLSRGEFSILSNDGAGRLR